MRKGIAALLSVLMLFSMMFSFAGCEDKQTKKSAAVASDKKAVSGENGSGEKAIEPVEELKPQPSEPEITAPYEETKATEPPVEEEPVSVWVISTKTAKSIYDADFINTVTQYDANGNLIEKTTYGGDTLISRTVYEYDENNNMLLESVYYDNGTTQEEASRCEYVYNQEGLLAEKTQYENSSELLRINYFYDNSGNLTNRSDHQMGKLSFEYDYIYDDSGNCIEVVRRNGNQASYSNTREYDDFGRLVLYCEYYNDVESYRCEYAYNEDGNLLWNYAVYSNTGSSYKTNCEYDTAGRITLKEEYVDGNLYSETVFSYDDAGNMIERILFVGSLEQDRVRYRYDEEGKLLETFSYEEGEQIIHAEYEMIKINVTPMQRDRLIAQEVAFEEITGLSLIVIPE